MYVGVGVNAASHPVREAAFSRIMDDMEQYSYSYDVWAPNTRVEFCTVPWDAAYRNVVRFNDTTARDAYFDGLERDTLRLTRLTYAKFGQPVLVNVPFNRINKYNYIRVVNDYAQVDDVTPYHYFIAECEYVAPNTTRIMVQLDAWQQFGYTARFGRCYVKRGHAGVANEKQFDHYGYDYLDAPEGLDTGAQMQVVATHFDQLYKVASKEAPNGSKLEFLAQSVVVVSNTDLLRDGGTESSPVLNSATGSRMDNIPNGSSVYIFPTFSDWATAAAKLSQWPWIAQGIVAIYVVPLYGTAFMKRIEETGMKTDIGGGTVYTNVAASFERDADEYRQTGFRSRFVLPHRYRHLKKFLTYPYASIEASCSNGTIVNLKPELVQSDDLTFGEIVQFAPPNAQIRFYPKQYNGRGGASIRPVPEMKGDWGRGAAIENAEWLDVSFGLTNFPQGTLLNNNAALTLASQAHSLAYAYQSAEWAQNKASLGISQMLANTRAANDYNTRATGAANTNRNVSQAISAQYATAATDIANNAAWQAAGNANFDTIVSSAAGAVGGLLSGNIGGAAASVAGGVTGVITTNRNTSLQTRTASAQTANSNAAGAAQTAQANSFATQMTDMGNRQATDVANMNASYARAAMQGDYANAIAGIDARVQDTMLTQPSAVGQLGGDTFAHANGFTGILTKYKQLPPNAMRIVGEYWLRYGYFVQQFMTPPQNLMCMTRFTYWEMLETNIGGAMPETYRQTLRGILEKGVTVWARPDDIMTLDLADNDPVQGFSY